MYQNQLFFRKVLLWSSVVFLMSSMFSLVMAQSNGVLREVWNNINGTAVSSLTSNAAYPNSPSSQSYISLFEGPTNTADNYGSRYRAYIIPPTTGSYTFWIAGDDDCELWISTDASATNRVKIASFAGYTNSREWTKYTSQQSTSRTLTAGQRYYIEALHKEGNGNDNLAVGWQGPGIGGDAERPIPSNRLVPWSNAQLSLTITNDTHGTTTPSGTITLNSGAAQSISAVPASGYQFSNWTVTSGTATIANPNSAATTVSLSSGNATIRANFTAIFYTLTMSSDGHGTTTPSGSVSVASGASTSISTSASSGYQFLNWTVTSGTANIANPNSTATTVALSNGNATIRANFIVTSYTLTMSNDGHGTTTPSGSVSVASGSPTSISTSATSGYQFLNWTVTNGTATIANANSATTTVALSNGNATIQANFTALPDTLIILNDGHGTTTPSGSVTVTSGAATSISAVALTGYQFSNWTVTSGTVSIANPNTAATTITMSSRSATIRANFTAVIDTLIMLNDGHGTTTPSGSVTVVSGASTSISAVASIGYQFSNWTVTSGTASIANPNSAVTTVIMSSRSSTIRANFVAVIDTLVMSNDGHGTTTPSGSVNVASGTATSISAVASTGYRFLNWTVTSGTASIANSSTAATTVTMSSRSATIRANFVIVNVFDTLRVTNTGNGTTTPTGTIVVARGVATTISATAQVGYHFTRWNALSGIAQIANSNAATTTVILTNGNATIQAYFEINQPSIPNNRRVAVSGTLYDDQGNPVGTPTPDTVDVMLQLMSAVTGGDTLYRESFLTQNGQGVVVDNGNFVVTLGAGIANADLMAVFAANANCFAEITILGVTPDVLLPRTPVTASPYSFSIPAASPTVLHGDGYPVDKNIEAVVGTYYVNDNDGTTWLRVNTGWKHID